MLCLVGRRSGRVVRGGGKSERMKGSHCVWYRKERGKEGSLEGLRTSPDHFFSSTHLLVFIISNIDKTKSANIFFFFI